MNSHGDREDCGVTFRLRNLQRSYGTTLAVNIQSLDIANGGTLCLLGPTGSGKSTLLRMLAGVESPTTGKIELGQNEIVTLAFQRPLLLSGSVRWNLEHAQTLNGGSRNEAEINAMLARFRLEGVAKQAAQSLSGGQTQLVSLARSLLVKPNILLLDEPTAHLDPAHVELVEKEIQKERQERDLTVIWATHNLFQARRISSRVGFMLAGDVIEMAKTTDFFENPQDARSQDFIAGKMIY